MTYIRRKLTITDENCRTKEVSDEEFFALEGPLVVLGEPGAGKSELMEYVAKSTGSLLVYANGIENIPVIEEQESPKKLLIDGLDEVTAYDATAGINSVLIHLKHLKAPNLLITCRSVDWQGATNSKIIKQRFGKEPKIATLSPLSDDEIIEFVNASAPSDDGARFIEEARSRGIHEFLKNPQSLLMLLKAVKNDGWPKSKTKLFETAVGEFIKEENDNHNELNRGRSSDDDLLDAAGLICAELLLAGKTGLALTSNAYGIPTLREFVNRKYPEALLKAALSTKCFRVKATGEVEPCHRTVAEYLGARWISAALMENLSQLRFEPLIYGENYVVPTALRGLHSWIATLCPSVTSLYIERDPYGVYRYGDLSNLTLQQCRALISNLEQVAKDDPYFRDQDWSLSLGRGLARVELRPDILRIIRNPNIPAHLCHLFLDAIRGSEFVSTVEIDLIAIIEDTSLPLYNRSAAFRAFEGMTLKTDWHAVALRLKSLGDFASLDLFFEIAEDGKLDGFPGAVLADAVIGYQRILLARSDRVVGVGYRLPGKLSLPQLEEMLITLSDHQAIADSQPRVERWLLEVLKERLTRAPKPSPKSILFWLRGTKSHGYEVNQWLQFAVPYFDQEIDCRREIQLEALAVAKDAKEFGSILWLLSYTYRGLYLRVTDFCFHLAQIIEDRRLHSDWLDRWELVYRYGVMHTDAKDDVEAFAADQARRSVEVKSRLDEIKHRLKSDPLEEEQNRVSQYEKQNQSEKQKRHESFKAHIEVLKSGKGLANTNKIAKAYLGQYIDLDESASPEERLREFVGADLVADALLSISATIKNNAIYPAREIIGMRAREEGPYFINQILVAHLHILSQADPDLQQIEIETARSALAAMDWGLYSKDELCSNLRSELERIVFNDETETERFLRDVFEPFLEVGSNAFTGLHRFGTDEKLANIAGKLSIEWLTRFESMSENAFKQLLKVALACAARSDVEVFVKREAALRIEMAHDPKREAILSLLFVLDFESNKSVASKFVREGKDRIWSIKEFVETESRKPENLVPLTASQNFFLIMEFGGLWPRAFSPSSWSGSQNPWNASDFIVSIIDALGSIPTMEASDLLKQLLETASLESYRDHIRHIFSQQQRNRAEAGKGNPSLSEVIKILNAGGPANHADLQAIVFDELEEFKRRVKHSNTNDLREFWEYETENKNRSAIPKRENDCRDRLTSQVRRELERHGIHLQPESAMPDDERADLLAIFNDMNIPIEIKCQWHEHIWLAGNTQLARYTKEYRSGERGIYLLLWFGLLSPGHKRNPKKCKGFNSPSTFIEFEKIAQSTYASLSPLVRVITVDLSDPKP